MQIHTSPRSLLCVVALATVACAAPSGVAETEELETIEIDVYGAHIHGLSRSRVTISGEVPEARGLVEVIATLDEGAIVSMTVAIEAGKRFAVPQHFFSGIYGVRENSFRIANGVTSPPRRVAGVVIWVSYASAEGSSSLACDEKTSIDPNERTLELVFHPDTRGFTKRLMDACGNEQP